VGSPNFGLAYYLVDDIMKAFHHRYSFFIGCALAAFALAGRAAAEEAPDVMIKRVSQEVIDIAKHDKEIQNQNFSRITALVQAKILPHLDMERATAITLGRHWREATPRQRQELIDNFRALLMYTYAGAMSQIKNQTLEFRPFHAAPGDTDVEVRFRVKRLPNQSEPVQVSYRLWKSPEGWKIYDVNVLGVWLSQTYRNSFSSEISRSGIDGLIATLEEKNKKLAAAKGQKAEEPPAPPT
jgi:phospholipid transport system substrate-binding protein